MSGDVLFVCMENAGRSQMGEAFFKKFASKKFSVCSAGITPSLNINPIAVKVMKEIGIDMSGQKPKLLSDDLIRDFATVINMGCMDQVSCPLSLVGDMIDWGIADPKAKSVDQVRVIRDEIKSNVFELLNTLEASD